MHTPGPWKLSGHEYPSAARGITVYCAQGVNIGTVCTTPYSGKGARAADYARVAAANARLIAAAPDLLAASIKALEALRWAEAAELPVFEHIEELERAIAKAQTL